MHRWQRAACIVWTVIVVVGVGRAAALLPRRAPRDLRPVSASGEPLAPRRGTFRSFVFERPHRFSLPPAGCRVLRAADVAAQSGRQCAPAARQFRGAVHRAILVGIQGTARTRIDKVRAVVPPRRAGQRQSAPRYTIDSADARFAADRDRRRDRGTLEPGGSGAGSRHLLQGVPPCAGTAARLTLSAPSCSPNGPGFPLLVGTAVRVPVDSLRHGPVSRLVCWGS